MLGGVSSHLGVRGRRCPFYGGAAPRRMARMSHFDLGGNGLFVPCGWPGTAAIIAAVVPPFRTAKLTSLEQRGSTVWQPTNVTNGDVLAFDGNASACVALVGGEANYRVLHSADDGLLWSMPWPDLPREQLVTALMAARDAVYAGLFMNGVVRAAYAAGGKRSVWEGTGHGLPEDAVVTSLAGSKDVVYAGTRRHGIFVHTGNEWSAIEGTRRSVADREAVAAMAVVDDHLVVADWRSLHLIRKDGRSTPLDPFAEAAPIGLVRTGRRGLVAWSTRAVRFSDDGGSIWHGLPDPPPDTMIRSAAFVGMSVLAVMQGPDGSCLQRWNFGEEEWSEFGASLPESGRPSSVFATPSGVLLGMGDGGIHRLLL